MEGGETIVEWSEQCMSLGRVYQAGQPCHPSPRVKHLRSTDRATLRAISTQRWYANSRNDLHLLTSKLCRAVCFTTGSRSLERLWTPIRWPISAIFVARRSSSVTLRWSSVPRRWSSVTRHTYFARRSSSVSE